MNRTTSLIEATSHLPEISIDEIAPGYPVIRVANQQATAAVALHGAHVISYQPANQAPVIFTSRDAMFREGKAIRGGIPICWPWFSAHRDAGKGHPSHGLARTRFWELSEARAEDGNTILTFTIATDGSDPSWPHVTRATLTITVGASLKLELRTDNPSDQEITMSDTLHAYFQVASAAETEVIGLAGADYVFNLTDTEVKTQSEPIVTDEPIDRVYHSTEATEIIDRAGDRTLHIDKQNSYTTVVWNPGAEIAAGMADLANDEYQNFVCVEPGNAWPAPLTIAAGESHTTSMEVSVK